MNVREMTEKRAVFFPRAPKEREDQWVKMSLPFVTQWLDAIRPAGVEPELFEELVQASHSATIDGDLVEHKYVKTQSVRKNTRDHSGLIPNLLDVAKTRKQVLEILTEIVDRSIQSLKEDKLYNKNNLQGFMAEEPLANWAFKGGQNIGDFVNGVISSDLLHSRIVRECKLLRGKKANEFYEKTNELFRQYQQHDADEITYTPSYYRYEKRPKAFVRRLVYVEQHIHTFSIIHSSGLDHLTPDALTKEFEPLFPDIENPIWTLHNSGKAGHPFSFVLTQQLKEACHIPDGQIHISVEQIDELGEWIRSRQ